jgi:hypothetical protein
MVFDPQNATAGNFIDHFLESSLGQGAEQHLRDPLPALRQHVCRDAIGIRGKTHEASGADSIGQLYSLSTRLLLALGQGVFASHHTRFTAPLTRTLRTLTHSAGAGSAPGLYQ